MKLWLLELRILCLEAMFYDASRILFRAQMRKERLYREYFEALEKREDLK